jgi:hypothetical protein
MLANAASDERVETLRRQRRIQQQNQEVATAHLLESQARAQEERRLLVEQDAALASALQQRKNAKVVEQSHAKRVCDESEELQQLKTALKAAQMNRVRSTQVSVCGNKHRLFPFFLLFSPSLPSFVLSA